MRDDPRNTVRGSLWPRPCRASSRRPATRGGHLVVQLGIMIEAQEGLTWERWEALITAADRLGFTWLRRSDHLFSTIASGERDSLELWPSLTVVPVRSERLRFGQMVSPITWRHPV